MTSVGQAVIARDREDSATAARYAEARRRAKEMAR